jgi:hyperosmotically inducible periplasmic protein
MKSGLISAAIVTAAMLGPMAVLAEDQGTDAQNVGHGTRVYVRDSVITTKVKARLAAEHITSLARIHVDTDANGVVYLSGTAQSQEAIDTAVRLARDTEHVRDVHSDIAVHDHD